MGYILKLKEDDKREVLMFYSKPEYGYYSNGSTRISEDQYDDWKNGGLADNMVWIENKWCDTSANDEECFGINTSEFVIDCILQGEKLEYNKLIEFHLSKK